MQKYRDPLERYVQNILVPIVIYTALAGFVMFKTFDNNRFDNNMVDGRIGACANHQKGHVIERTYHSLAIK